MIDLLKGENMDYKFIEATHLYQIQTKVSELSSEGWYVQSIMLDHGGGYICLMVKDEF